MFALDFSCIFFCSQLGTFGFLEVKYYLKVSNFWLAGGGKEALGRSKIHNTNYPPIKIKLTQTFLYLTSISFFLISTFTVSDNNILYVGNVFVFN